MEFIGLDFVDQNPVRFYVAIPEVFPLAPEGVVFELGREFFTCHKQVEGLIAGIKISLLLFAPLVILWPGHPRGPELGGLEGLDSLDFGLFISFAG